jgi:shikimate dehydrogenase
MKISGKTRVAGVVGHPVSHTLSPSLHNAWIAAAGLDAVYVPLRVFPEAFPAFINGLRGGSIAGLNVTVPFKTVALTLADEVTPRARLAQAANVLVFGPEGTVFADNTDGLGLLAAFAVQAPGFDPAARRRPSSPPGRRMSASSTAPPPGRRRSPGTWGPGSPPMGSSPRAGLSRGWGR